MTSITNEEYKFITDFVYDYSRINLGDNKKELVTARLGKRLRAHGLKTYSDYIKLIQSPQGKEEIINLVDAISTNHTFFFREINHFNFMTDVGLPQFKNLTGPLRVWSAASSSGEEPYSLAIFLAEIWRKEFSIEASDISTKILKKAQEGIYAQDRLREMKPDWQRRYFQKGVGKFEGQYRLKDATRDKVNYRRLNLFDATYPFQKPFHFIFCRNVMIYFDRPTQEGLVNRLTQHLVPGGYLHIGNSESLTGITHKLKPLKPAIYQKPEA